MIVLPATCHNRQRISCGPSVSALFFDLRLFNTLPGRSDRVGISIGLYRCSCNDPNSRKQARRKGYNNKSFFIHGKSLLI